MYYVYKTCGYVVIEETQKGLLDTFEPQTTESTEWKHWVTHLDLRTCLFCRMLHGQIFSVGEPVLDEPPIHDRCRCNIEMMKAVRAGDASKEGKNGADWWIKHYSELPDYYITKRAAKEIGWVNWKGNLADVAPNKMVNGEIYRNANGHLPQAQNRIWYEADINYESGFRNTHRVLYSNDGLIFVTYDHYATFFQII